MELSPQIAMTAALDLRRHLAQACGAVVGSETLPGQSSNGGVVARVQKRLPIERTVFCDEQEDEPIDRPQELSVEVSERQHPGPQGIA